MSSIPPPPLPGPQTNHPRAIASLVCGIIGIVVLPMILGIVAIILGYRARNEIRAQPEKYKGDGMALSGLVLGGLDLVGAVLLLSGLM